MVFLTAEDAISAPLTMARRLQSPDMRHVRVGKDNTTITLENEFWEQLRVIAITRNIAISQLLAEIDARSAPRSESLFYRRSLHQGGQDRVRTLSAAARSSSRRRSAAYSCE
jgi:predicted DNA-binding ribbon-helix-helix protein